MSVFRVFLGLGVLAAGAAACSPAAPSPSAPKPPERPASSASPSPSPSPIKLGEVAYADQGTEDASTRTRRGLTLEDNAFNPTFIRGTPGQVLKLRLQNKDRTAHNFSIPGQQIDVDVPAGVEQVDVSVTFPQSGAVRFFCKLHTAQGMNGQLLVGETAPRPVADAAPGGATQ